ncbi:hypothetical protein PUN28_015790 [Cardiocondyla obscurior]|uniref:Uncharacterized protein n=1 Tax=Cardiocondyla obscurior TaxID=286306 RepID=A0AAW2EZY0_9HYME
MHTGLFRAFYFYQQPKYGQKTKKNIFEIWQRSIVQNLKKMHTGLFQVFYFHQYYGQKTIKNIFDIRQQNAYGLISSFLPLPVTEIWS